MNDILAKVDTVSDYRSSGASGNPRPKALWLEHTSTVARALGAQAEPTRGCGRGGCGVVVISKPQGKGGTQTSSFHRKGEYVDSSKGMENTL